MIDSLRNCIWRTSDEKQKNQMSNEMFQRLKSLLTQFSIKVDSWKALAQDTLAWHHRIRYGALVAEQSRHFGCLKKKKQAKNKDSMKIHYPTDFFHKCMKF